MDDTRIVSKIDVRSPDECWLWTAAKTSRGYGNLKLDGRMRLAHRVVYELFVGPIPDGLVIDHLCRVKACVNPDHLEAVTQRENIMRGTSPRILTYLTGICQRGHSMKNAKIITGGYRACRTCINENQRRGKF